MSEDKKSVNPSDAIKDITSKYTEVLSQIKSPISEALKDFSPKIPRRISLYTPPSPKYTYYTDSIIRLQDKLDSINDSDDDLFSVAFNTIDNIYHMIVKSITQSN